MAARGLLESVYESCLCQELGHQGLNFKRQVYVPLKYKGVTCSELFYIDILVENELIVEIKADEKDHSLHKAQLLTYLRVTGLKRGLLINFGRECVKDGIHRISN